MNFTNRIILFILIWFFGFFPLIDRFTNQIHIIDMGVILFIGEVNLHLEPIGRIIFLWSFRGFTQRWQQWATIFQRHCCNFWCFLQCWTLLIIVVSGEIGIQRSFDFKDEKLMNLCHQRIKNTTKINLNSRFFFIKREDGKHKNTADNRNVHTLRHYFHPTLPLAAFKGENRHPRKKFGSFYSVIFRFLRVKLLRKFIRIDGTWPFVRKWANLKEEMRPIGSWTFFCCLLANRY